MDADTWHRIKDRPQAVRTHREDILDAVTDSVAEAMPAPDASTFEYRQFLNDHADEVGDDLSTTEDADDEPEAEA